MIPAEEVYVQNADEWAAKAKKHKTKRTWKAQEELDRKEEPRAKLLGLQCWTWTYSLGFRTSQAIVPTKHKQNLVNHPQNNIYKVKRKVQT